MSDSTYDNPMKQVAWEAFLEAWDLNNRGDLDLDPVHVNTAEMRFERWWDREYTE